MNRLGLPATQPALPLRQVLHEGDQRVYRGHQQGQLIYFHNPWPHLRILADEAGTKITTANCLHYSKSRAIPLDHLTDGTTGMSGKLPKVDGTSSTRFPEHPNLHWQRIDPYWHSRETLGSSGTSSDEATSAPPEDQFGQMPFWRQTSILPGIYPNSRGHQTGQGQTESNQECWTTQGQQGNLVLHGTV